MKWKTINKIPVDIYVELQKYLHKEDIIFHIGTDAQTAGKNMADFATVIVVHTVGRGARVFYWKEKKVRVNSLWEKLYGETERSLRIAIDLTKVFGQDITEDILVHVDANTDTKYASSNHVKALAGMVIGYGFKHVLKPYAWASSHCADHIVKNKN